MVDLARSLLHLPVPLVPSLRCCLSSSATSQPRIFSSNFDSHDAAVGVISQQFQAMDDWDELVTLDLVQLPLDAPDQHLGDEGVHDDMLWSRIRRSWASLRGRVGVAMKQVRA